MTPKTPNNAQAVAMQMAEESIGYRVRRLNRFVTRIFDQALQSQEVKVSQLALLAAIELMAPVPPGELGSRIGLEKSTVSRNVKLMAEHGWIKTRQAEDGRSQLLELTSKGRLKLVAAYPAWSAAEKEIEQTLGKGAANRIDGMLNRCC